MQGFFFCLFFVAPQDSFLAWVNTDELNQLPKIPDDYIISNAPFRISCLIKDQILPKLIAKRLFLHTVNKMRIN